MYYKIVSHVAIDSLEEDVLLLIARGWKPLGGMTVSNEIDTRCSVGHDIVESHQVFYQTLAKD